MRRHHKGTRCSRSIANHDGRRRLKCSNLFGSRNLSRALSANELRDVRRVRCVNLNVFHATWLYLNQLLYCSALSNNACDVHCASFVLSPFRLMLLLLHQPHTLALGVYGRRKQRHRVVEHAPSSPSHAPPPSTSTHVVVASQTMLEADVVLLQVGWSLHLARREAAHFHGLVDVL